jgi:hypothetical protein
MNSIKENLAVIKEKIENAAVRSARDAREIELIAVTKTVGVDRINEGISAGIEIIGENKVQEAQEKKDKIQPVKWHMVGHLQRNKVKYAVKIFDMIQSVDTLKLAREISKRCQALGKSMPVLIEVNTSGEDSKYGCKPAEVSNLVTEISTLPGIHIEGLMTIGLFTDDMNLVRPCFVELREISEKVKELHLESVSMKHLSMGMSADYPVAIEEGATMVRIGTAIFGQRSYSN